MMHNNHKNTNCGVTKIRKWYSGGTGVQLRQGAQGRPLRGSDLHAELISWQECGRRRTAHRLGEELPGVKEAAL
jgi:hypothetical protein